MNRIGILGGTFDPIHLGHLRLAEVVLEKIGLDKIFFVPSNLPPHKNSSGLAPANERLRMVRLAVRGNPCFAVSDFEVKRPGKSYSIDTVRYFFRRFPESKIFFIIGLDSVSTLSAWKDIGEILKTASFVAVSRPGDYARDKTIKHSLVTMPGMDISSSHIRQLVKARKSIRYLVPEEVRKFIAGKKIY